GKGVRDIREEWDASSRNTERLDGIRIPGRGERSASGLLCLGDEKTPLVMVGTNDCRHLVELPAHERGLHPLGEHEAIDVGEYRALRSGLENRSKRKRAEARDVGTAGGGRKRGPLGLRSRERGLRERVRAALDDRLVKKACRLRGGQLRVNAVAACRLAEDCD